MNLQLPELPILLKKQPLLVGVGLEQSTHKPWQGRLINYPLKSQQACLVKTVSDVNPSGTATTLDILAFPFRQVSSASLSAINAFLRFKGDVTKAPLFVGSSAIMDTKGEKNASNKGN